MQVEHFSNEEHSPEDIKQLEKLQRSIEAAVSDGKLSHYELERIKTIAFSNKKLLSAELQLYSTKSIGENWSMSGNTLLYIPCQKVLKGALKVIVLSLLSFVLTIASKQNVQRAFRATAL